VEESQHEEGVAVGAEGEQQAEPTLTTAATGELHSAGLTPGKGAESGQSAPTPTILVEVPERKTSGKLSRIEEEKEEELARFAGLSFRHRSTYIVSWASPTHWKNTAGLQDYHKPSLVPRPSHPSVCRLQE